MRRATHSAGPTRPYSGGEEPRLGTDVTCGRSATPQLRPERDRWGLVEAPRRADAAPCAEHELAHLIGHVTRGRCRTFWWDAGQPLVPSCARELRTAVAASLSLCLCCVALLCVATHKARPSLKERPLRRLEEQETETSSNLEEGSP